MVTADKTFLNNFLTQQPSPYLKYMLEIFEMTKDTYRC